MGCTNNQSNICDNGYDYYYNDCCNYGMTAFWSIMLWISLALCVCMCCSMMMAAMRRRRMQMMAAQQRNNGGQYPQQ